MTLDDILIRIEKPVINGTIALLGAVAIGIQVAEGIAWVVKHKGQPQ